MNINLEHCRIFKEVAEQKSFTAAASKLFVSQSAISQAIKQLESDLSLQLFYRNSKGVSLTASGEILYAHASSAINLLNTAQSKLESLKNLGEGELRIGASDTVSQKLLIPHLEQYSRVYPNIKLKIANRTSFESAALLRSGELDIAFVNTPIDDPSLTLIPFADVHDVFVGMREYAGRSYSFSDIAKLPLILLERKSASRRYVEQLFKANGVALAPEIELGSHDLLLSFARIGLGVSCVIREFSESFIQNGELAELKLSQPIPPRKLAIAYLKDISLSPAAKRFIEQVGGS